MGVIEVATPSTKSTSFSRGRRSGISRGVALATCCTGKWRPQWLRTESIVTRSLPVEFGVVRRQRAQDLGVAGPGGQEVVDLPPPLIVTADSASGLEVDPADGSGSRDSPFARTGRGLAQAIRSWAQVLRLEGTLFAPSLETKPGKQSPTS